MENKPVKLIAFTDPGKDLIKSIDIDWEQPPIVCGEPNNHLPTRLTLMGIIIDALKLNQKANINFILVGGSDKLLISEDAEIKPKIRYTNKQCHQMVKNGCYWQHNRLVEVYAGIVRKINYFNGDETALIGS